MIENKKERNIISQYTDFTLDIYELRHFSFCFSFLFRKVSEIFFPDAVEN